MEFVLRVVNRVIAMTFYLGSAAAAALVTALLVRGALGVSPAVLRLDAFIAAGLVGLLLLVTMAGAREDND
jgi:hypothetical protein